MNLYQADARCKACGGERVMQILCKTHIGAGSHLTPLIHRACVRCGNTWNELPLDAPTDFGLNKITDGDLKKGD